MNRAIFSRGSNIVRVHGLHRDRPGSGGNLSRLPANHFYNCESLKSLQYQKDKLKPRRRLQSKAIVFIVYNGQLVAVQ
jgi:hypothetical protein